MYVHDRTNTMKKGINGNLATGQPFEGNCAAGTELTVSEATDVSGGLTCQEDDAFAFAAAGAFIGAFAGGVGAIEGFVVGGIIGLWWHDKYH